MLARFLPLEGDERALLERYLRPAMRSWNGAVVGTLRPAEVLSA
jgi:hypothetical protein